MGVDLVAVGEAIIIGVGVERVGAGGDFLGVGEAVSVEVAEVVAAAVVVGVESTVDAQDDVVEEHA